MAGEPKFEVRGVGPELRARIKAAAQAARMTQSAWVIRAVEAQIEGEVLDTSAARDLRETSVNLRQAVAALRDLDLRIAREVKRALQTVAATEGGMAAPADQQRRPAGKANRN